MPDAMAHTINLNDLPGEWDMEPPQPELQQWGSKQLAQYGILRIPSVIIPEEFNVIVAPEHDAFKQLVIGQPRVFHWDPKLRSC
jgi:RES domain-containing protein